MEGGNNLVDAHVFFTLVLIAVTGLAGLLMHKLALVPAKAFDTGMMVSKNIRPAKRYRDQGFRLDRIESSVVAIPRAHRKMTMGLYSSCSQTTSTADRNSIYVGATTSPIADKNLIGDSLASILQVERIENLYKILASRLSYLRLKVLDDESGSLRGLSIIKLALHCSPLSLSVFRVLEGSVDYRTSQQEHPDFGSGNFEHPLLDSAQSGYFLEGLGALTILCSFGSILLGFCGMNYRDWRMSIAAFLLAIFFFYLSVFLIHRGLDSTDPDSSL
ncbi:MAG: hypothetical protein WCB05_21435, partial [Candidatus Sulfotelmatobacter sp.]